MVFLRKGVVMKKLYLMLLGFVAFVVGAVNEAAAGSFTISPPTFDYSQLGNYAGTILTALAAIWLIRKFIKMTNRS